MNTELINTLEEMRRISEIRGEVYREKAYRKAISSIKRLTYKISKDHLPDLRDNKIPGVGEGILSKIVEFITKGRIAELEKLKKSKEVQAHKILGGILGIGPAAVEDLISKKIYTLAQLRKAIATGKVQLNHMQKLGLAYYRDLNERIPRAEVTALGEFVRRTLVGIKPGIRFEISGSYRRGAQTSGDIDIIITHENYDGEFLTKFRNAIAHDQNFIDTISSGEQRLTFLYRAPESGKVRQIDLLWIPMEQYWPAVFYFTGSGNWNEYTRGIAKKKGLRLNQMGLFRVKSNGDLEPIPVRTEHDIFAALEIPYRSPEERNM